MSQRLANFFSYACHPAFMPVFLFTIVFYFCKTAVLIDSYQMILLLAYISLFSTFLPLFSVFLLKRSKAITNLQLESRKERILPFMIITIYYTLLAYGLVERNFVGILIGAVAVGMAVAMLFLTLATNFLKVSAHATAASGIFGTLVGVQVIYGQFNLLLPIIICAIITGLVMSARLALNSHTPYQVFSGFFLGWFSCFLSVTLIVGGSL